MQWVRIYLLKGFLNAGDLIGRWFFFHDYAPPVGRMRPDLAYGSNPRQKLDVIEPEGKAPRPVLIYLHGGGWIAGDKASYTGICRRFVGRGYLAVNANYRLTPNHPYPAQLRDAAAVVRWTYGEIERFGGDRQRIVLAGDSAGAQLISWYASALNRPALLKSIGLSKEIPHHTIKALLLFYGVFDLEGLYETPLPAVNAMMRGLLGSDPERFRRNARIASSMHHLCDRLPPCFLCTSDLDALQPQTLETARRLRELGVTVETLLLSHRDYPHARHGFLNFYRRKCAQVAMGKALDFTASVCPPHRSLP